MILEYVLFIAAGLFLGVLIGLFFFRGDETWVKLTSLSTGQAAFTGLFLAYYQFFGLNEEHKLNLFIVYFCTALVAALASIAFFISTLKKQSGPFQISITDILLGHRDLVKNHYEYRKKQLDNDLNISKLETQAKDLQSQLSDLAKRKKAIEKKEAKIIEDTESLNKAIAATPHISIPVDKNLPVDKHFLKILPHHLSTFTEFHHQITSFTDDFIAEIPSRREQYSDLDIIKAYIAGMCIYTGECLFKWHGIRVHIRLLNEQTKKYEKWLAFIDHKEYEDSLTAIPPNEGMIFHSSQTKRSLVKSANPDLHKIADNDNIWEDYITFTFDNFKLNGLPALSMGISVKNEEAHRDMLYFLSFIQFEQVIKNSLKILDKHLPFVGVINKAAA